MGSGWRDEEKRKPLPQINVVDGDHPSHLYMKE